MLSHASSLQHGAAKQTSITGVLHARAAPFTHGRNQPVPPSSEPLKQGNPLRTPHDAAAWLAESQQLHRVQISPV